MLVIEANGYGGLDVLTAVQRPEPPAGPGRVRVRVRATAVNPVDSAIRAGAFSAFTPDIQVPFVLGWDFAGTLIDATPGLAAGTAVAGFVPWIELGTGAGAWSEVIATDPEWLAPIPAELGFTAAAAVPITALTATQALSQLEIQAGQHLLITGASGSVGGFAVQLATRLGAQVSAVASAGDAEYVAGLGAGRVIERDHGTDLVERLTAFGGFDAVLDTGTVGPALIAAARDGGAYLATVDSLEPATERGIRVTTVHVRNDRTTLAGLLAEVSAGRLSTRIDSVLPLTDAAEGQRRVEAGGLRGKVVLEV